MRSISKEIFRLFTVLLFLTFVHGALAEETFKDFDGNPHAIKDFVGNGKWMVVMLWASDCHVCNQEINQYIAFHKNHMDKDAVVLGVSLDGDEKKADANDFFSRHKVNFPSLIGEPEQVAAMYQNLTGAEWIGTPTFMVYTPAGKLLGAQVGAVPPEIIESFIDRESQAAKK